jgi:hypothetical protein
VRIGDRVGVPLLITAPWPHCEQIKSRGSDMAVAPTWPQEGQTIRVNMAVTAERYLALAQAQAQSGDVIGAENYYQHAEHYYKSMSSDREAT